MSRQHAELTFCARRGERVDLLGERDCLPASRSLSSILPRHDSSSDAFMTLAFGLHLLDVADHVEGLLREVVEIAGEDLLEARDGLLQRDVLAGAARELRGDEERLREEALDLARATTR